MFLAKQIRLCPRCHMARFGPSREQLLTDVAMLKRPDFFPAANVQAVPSSGNQASSSLPTSTVGPLQSSATQQPATNGQGPPSDGPFPSPTVQIPVYVERASTTGPPTAQNGNTVAEPVKPTTVGGRTQGATTERQHLKSFLSKNQWPENGFGTFRTVLADSSQTQNQPCTDCTEKDPLKLGRLNWRYPCLSCNPNSQFGS